MDATLEYDSIGVMKKDCWFNERESGDWLFVISDWIVKSKTQLCE